MLISIYAYKKSGVKVITYRFTYYFVFFATEPKFFIEPKYTKIFEYLKQIMTS